MKLRMILFFLVFVLFSGQSVVAETEEKIFSTLEGKKQFADDISVMFGKAWKKWQDSVLVGDIKVEGSCGMLLPGDIANPVFTSSGMLEYFDRNGKSRVYIDCIKVVVDAFKNGMRSWQRGYSNKNIPFPQGASCVYTLPPCNNVPVTVASGRSLGDREMTKKALYSYMLYHASRKEKDILIVFHSVSKAAADCFIKWKDSCSIVGILASGGIAPQPAPMGAGPGPVRGAKGQNGKLIGSYFDSDLMYAKMVEYFKKEE